MLFKIININVVVVDRLLGYERSDNCIKMIELGVSR